MNSAKNASSKFPFRTGFLIVGVAWGTLLGHIVADWPSNSIGLHWYENHYPEYFGFTVAALIAGPIVGITIGLLLDGFLKNEVIRGRTLEVLSMTFWIFLVLYAMMFPALATGVR